MWRPVPMVHLRVQVPQRDASAATRAIARAGLLHLVDLAHGRAPANAPVSVELLTAFRELERRVREVARRLDHKLVEPTGKLRGAEPADFEAERAQLEERLAPVERAVEERFSERSRLRSEADRLQAAAVRARALSTAGLDATRVSQLRFTDLRIGVAREADLEQLAELLAPAPFSITPLEAIGESWLFALVIPASARERLTSALRVVPCELGPPPAEPPDELEQRAQATAADAEKQRDQLSHLEAEAGPTLDELAQRAQLGVLLLQAQLLFATVGRFVVISGWVPAADAARLRDALAEATSSRAVVDLSAPEELAEVASGQLRVPILHRNPLLLRPFQQLIGLYGEPSYREVEPTAFFAISFLLMFGFMFGDIGHGATLFLAGFFVLRYFPRFLDYGVLLMEAGTSSAIFGALYGSLFGREDLLPALWMRPMHNLTAFMGIATVMGVVLISIGLVLNVVNAWRSGEKVRALSGLNGLLGAFLYWVTLALLARGFLPQEWRLPSWALLSLVGVPVVLLILRPILVRVMDKKHTRKRVTEGPVWLRALEGSIELVDVVFSFFANTFSFVRVAAFAAVHAGVMVALQAVVDTLSSLRFGTLWAIVGMIAGNVLVILLEGLTVSVQILRLEYYEFFNRFFRGGGDPYRPLMLQKGIGHGLEKVAAPSGDGGRPPGAPRSVGVGGR